VPIFAGRGVIYDRNNIPLAFNAPSETDVSTRSYATSTGLAHVLGYVNYPTKDKNGFYYRNDFEGADGIEKYYNEDLSGQNGSRLVEVDSQNKIISQNTVRMAESGKNIVLSIDSRVQSALFENIKDVATRVGFKGGAGIIMDVNTGEVLAMTSYPEYNSKIMSDKTDKAEINKYIRDSGLPFLNRVLNGLYIPGSIVKPYVAIGALNEGVIDPKTIIHTVGQIEIQNPYDKTKSTIFKDWKNLGDLDMRNAISMSSDAYFYIVGGGYKDQKGLGIARLDKYFKLFGLASPVTDSFFAGKSGNIPTPEWKKQTFNEDWYVGNTYHTAIGQYGMLVTPVEMVRAVAAIANEGNILKPSIIKGSEKNVERKIDEIPSSYYEIVREGMRKSAVEGTGKNLNLPYVTVATKTGTAELGISKENVNSWVTGYFPYEKPHYAFAVIMENGSVHNVIGAVAVMREQFEWMNIHANEYFK
jgi:penicillin-binding protein 2